MLSPAFSVAPFTAVTLSPTISIMSAVVLPAAAVRASASVAYSVVPILASTEESTVSFTS